MNEQPGPQVPDPVQSGSGPQSEGSRRHRRVVAGAALAAGLAIGGAGVAAAVTSSNHSSTAASSTTSASVASQGAEGQHHAGKHHRRAGHRGDALERRALHGELTVRAPGSKAGSAITTRVLLIQRGSVTAVSSASITVKSVDGFTATYPVNSSTKVRAAGKPATISVLKPGAKVHVLAVKGGAALMVGEVGPHPRMTKSGTTTPSTASGAAFSLDGAVVEL